MKTRKIISIVISTIIISFLLVFSSCKKKTYYPIPQEAIDYFACYGNGSVWTYIDKDSTLHECTLINYTEALYSNWTHNEWDVITYELEDTSYWNSILKIQINWNEEDLDYGWRVKGWDGVFWTKDNQTFCFRTPNTYQNHKLDSIIVNNKTYFNILYFTSNYGEYFFAKNIGLIKFYKLNSSGNNAITDSLTIVDYKLK